MKDDANLDLPVDDEYEDLRAELLAYHSALASLASGVSADSGRSGDSRRSNSRLEESRRSMKNTACWKLGGVCVGIKLCKGEQFLTEVPGCKNKLEVCCFAWNKYRLRFNDMHKIGIPNSYYPWSDIPVVAFGGKGLVPIDSPKKTEGNKKKKKLYDNWKNYVLVIDKHVAENIKKKAETQISRSLPESSAPSAVAVVLKQTF
ncbi:uncharacterized protein LOC113233182 [Hyposmocoma kahamanoa]|uniref:uncharacterized protein LOC113233182 n=1 Tax=Hyposmocoma kahamanoa TaxID=1477025 RepID=UPI000E6D7FB5|nr:uncharacterized protein LOC113233182 [Hyposmocoma kahamanoa]